MHHAVLVCWAVRILSERFWEFLLQVCVCALSPTAIYCPNLNQGFPVHSKGIFIACIAATNFIEAVHDRSETLLDCDSISESVDMVAWVV